MAPDLILFLTANPSNTSRLALDSECSAIERELRMAAHRDFDFQSRWAVTVDELMHHLNALQPTVIHFSGHGIMGPRAPDGEPGARRDAEPAGCPGESGICLENDRREAQLVTGDALTRMIRSTAASVRLVVLNACYSDAQAEAMCEAVDCVVGMGGAIADDTARAFAVSFYRALGHRRSVANAVEQAVATIAGKLLPGDQLPRCRTRDGVDASRVILSGPAVRSPSWTQRLDAMLRLSREAHEKLASDPFGTAARAQQALGHLVDYLHERELGAVDLRATLEAKLKRIEAKQVVPPMVASHFGSVLAHTSLVLHGGEDELSPAEPSLLQPCLGSLVVAFRWFFREYLKQPVPELGWQLGHPGIERPQIPDATPVNSTTRTKLSTGTRFGTGIGEVMPVWRTKPATSTLRIEAAADGVPEERVFKIEHSSRTYCIGRTEQRSDGKSNDFALPREWVSVSRDQGTLAAQDGGVLLTNTSSKDNVFVRGEAVSAGSARFLRHGDTVQLGRSIGTFSDGRYYAATPAAAIDLRTGLLSRLGLVAEIGGVLAIGGRGILFVTRCPEDVGASVAAGDLERRAVMVAAALHRRDPSCPVARFEQNVAMVLGSEDAVEAMAAVANQVASARCVSGFAMLTGTADQALPRLEACIGALSRIAIAGREPAGPEDLTRYALVPTPLEAFAAKVRPLFEIGGGAVLFALGDLERLHQMAPQVVPVLELELMEMLGARIGPRDFVSFAAAGLLLFGTAGDVERVAQEVAVTWHARGPVTANAIEIDRCLSAHLLSMSDLDDLTRCTAALARGETSALSASSLPVPLALDAIAIDQARNPVERARALVRLAELAWKLLAFILMATSRGLQPGMFPGDEEPDPGSWPAPWRSIARAAARTLNGQPARVMELASLALAPDRDGPVRAAMNVIAGAATLVASPAPDPAALAPALPRLERAIRDTFAAFAPLRGWTLVAIVSAEVVDVDGTTQRIEYIDYTGSSVRGSYQRVTVMGFRVEGPDGAALAHRAAAGGAGTARRCHAARGRPARYRDTGERRHGGGPHAAERCPGPAE